MNTRKYTLNLEFFKHPNIINSYWAGFLAADGYIRENLKHICLRLKNTDKHHISHFCKDIEYNGPIRDKKSSINSKKLKGFKQKEYFSSEVTICGAGKNIIYLKTIFNIIQAKSLTLKPPNNLNKNCSLAYIKGIIDGDGTIRLDKNNRIELSICGTKEILEYIAGYVNDLVPNTKYNKSKPRHRKDKTTKNHYTYKVTGFRALKFLSILDNISTPKLDRKWKHLKLSCMPVYKNEYEQKKSLKRKNKPIIDLVNYRFHNLLVVSNNGKNERNEYIWKCVCDCGKETTAKTNVLKSGRKRSCGCLKRLNWCNGNTNRS